MGITDSTRQRRFSAEKMQKLNLFETDQMFCDVYCLGPGAVAWSAPDEPHGVANESEGDLVLLVAMAPNPNR